MQTAPATTVPSVAELYSTRSARVLRKFGRSQSPFGTIRPGADRHQDGQCHSVSRVTLIDAAIC